MFKRYTSVSLILRIVIGIVIGAILGVLVPSWTAINILGDLFVGALRAIAPLLVFMLILSAISKYESGSKNHFGTVVILYITATLVAALSAVGASYIFKIHLLFPQATHIAEKAPQDLGSVVTNLLTKAVSNPVAALVQANYLTILFWGLIIGFGLRHASKGTKQVIADFSKTIEHAAQFIIEFAPFGIIGLLHNSIATTGFAGIARYGQLVLLLVGTMVFTYLVVYAAMVGIMTRQNPFPLIFWTLKVSGIPAFFTRSSAVNIPVNLQACADLGLNEKSYAVSIALGGTANSGGAAITVSIMTLAAANTLGIHVSFPLALMLCVLSAISATGSSGIAGGSLLLIPMSASLFGISNEIAMQVVAIGFIIGVIQDSVETAVNSAADLLFTATAEYHDLMKDGQKVDITAAVHAADAKRSDSDADTVSASVKSAISD
ncbi:serine/threonine transporter SstT [Lacticaseibacillus zhaodongensis]|uniref:serine/threonine transporter SstT n=1 Tax=Lacticaseibacillus zhaodongensis TaxID=2668065 RepID=UPI0012D2AFCC|nr:serine/threonine transporter SstT [Lacticaseibacillus zhaodongensis]